VFNRAHHQRIAQVLSLLNAPLLRDYGCLFGGGTAIALRFGEYRESVDMDFMVSNASNYGKLRAMLSSAEGVAPIFIAGQQLVSQQREIRADQYGIRTVLAVSNQPIKFEIILEGRVALEPAAKEDQICGVSTLTLLDMATTKLLANSDRWADDVVFNRDLIDLAMMQPTKELLQRAIAKASAAYGESIVRDLNKAIDRMLTRQGWLERCMQSLSITAPKAVLWDRIQSLAP
jgi:hypothetical protein